MGGKMDRGRMVEGLYGVWYWKGETIVLALEHT